MNRFRGDAGLPLPAPQPRVAVRLAPYDPPCPTVPRSPSSRSFARALSARANRDRPNHGHPKSCSTQCGKTPPLRRAPRPLSRATHQRRGFRGPGCLPPTGLANPIARKRTTELRASPRSEPSRARAPTTDMSRHRLPGHAHDQSPDRTTTAGFPTAGLTPVSERQPMPPDGFCRPRRSTSTPTTILRFRDPPRRSASCLRMTRPLRTRSADSP
jgi:hypothetical protein